MSFPFLRRLTTRPRLLPGKHYFARRVIRISERPGIMRKHIYTGAMGTVYGLLMTGVIFTHFGNEVGMTPLLWGVMGAVSSLMLLAQLLSALLTQRIGRRKVLWFRSAISHHTLRLLGILLAFLLWGHGWPGAVVVLIVLISMANFFGAMSIPPWMAWLADLIPEEDHGHFWGRRQAWVALAVISVSLPVALLVDFTPTDAKVYVALGVFLLATGLGFADLFIHGTIPEPRPRIARKERFFQELLVPFRDRGFRPWLIFNFCWTYAMFLGGGLSMIYLLKELELKDNLLGGMLVVTVLPLLGGMLTGKRSGILVDRIGPKRALWRSHLAWSFVPLPWLLATPETAVWLIGTGAFLLSGIAATASMTAQTKLITRYPLPRHRPMYVAVSNCLANAAGGLGVLTAGVTISLLGETWRYTVAGTTLGPFHVLFIASLLLRLFATLFMARHIKDPEKGRERVDESS